MISLNELILSHLASIFVLNTNHLVLPQKTPKYANLHEICQLTKQFEQIYILICQLENIKY